MARFVKLTRTTPYRIEPKDFPQGGKSIWICACGLTKNPPYCDQSHTACEGEPEGSLFLYESGVRCGVADPSSGPWPPPAPGPPATGGA